MQKRYRRYINCCLYVINFPNGKRYFGITTGKPRNRYLGHLKSARTGSRVPVAAAIRKYGAEFALFKVLAIGDVEYIKDLEVASIAHFKSLVSANGYNVSPGGDMSPMLIPAVAKRMSRKMRKRLKEDPEYKAEIISRLGDTQSPEARAKRLATFAANFKPPSKATRRKISKALKGRVQGQEEIDRRVAARLENGKEWSQEARDNASISQQNRIRTEEELARLRSYAETPYERTPKNRQLSSIAAKIRWLHDANLGRPGTSRIPKEHPAFAFGPGSSAGFLF
jgi:hypothetical protein